MDNSEVTRTRHELASLPALWERSCVFVANIQSLFFGNRDQTNVLESEIRGLGSYGGRLLPIIDILFGSGDNLLVVDGEPNADLLDYLGSDLGLSLPDLYVAPSSVYGHFETAPSASARAVVDRLQSHQAQWMDGFVTDTGLETLAAASGKRTISSVNGSRGGNNKLYFHEYLENQGLPTFDTQTARDEDEVARCVQELLNRGYRSAVVKAQIGASGVGMRKLDSLGDGHVPPYMFHEGPCLVQGWLEDGVHCARVIGSPSVQLFIADDEVWLYDVTEQILSADSIHEGNVSPPPYLGEQIDRQLLLSAAEVAAHWLHGQGYRGTASADFLLLERGGKAEAIVAELNARVTGATYPALLARYFSKGAWMMRNVRFEPPRTGADILAILENGECLFHSGQPGGVLPINFNMNSDGEVAKGQFLCLGEQPDVVDEVSARVESLLDVDWQYDRD